MTDNRPAIACFKSLTKLNISSCYKLTNTCLVNGIKVCDKLRKITLCYANDQFTEASGLDCFEQRGYRVQQIPPSHVADEPQFYGENNFEGNHYDSGLRHKRFVLY